MSSPPTPEPLLPPGFLFRVAVPCRHHPLKWTTGAGLQLDETYRLTDLGELDSRLSFAEVRAAWNRTGLAFWVRVQGKRQSAWCRESQFDESDGLSVFIDTRDTHNIHRAGRFCHRFTFLPGGGGARREDPLAGQLLINRAREHPRPASLDQLLVRSEKRVDGYILEAMIRSGALTGFDPNEHPRLGFTYCINDRELGAQTFVSGDGLPYKEDPSLWGTLDLIN